MIVVPLLTFLAVACLCLPREGGVRLALLRAAVLVGGAACLAVEALSAAHALHRPVIIIGWIVALLVTGGLAIRAFRRPELGPRDRWAAFDLRGRWAALAPVERLMVVALGGIFLLDLVIAVIAPPNNFDSQTYHLPKIEHWVQQRWPQLKKEPGASTR